MPLMDATTRARYNELSAGAPPKDGSARRTSPWLHHLPPPKKAPKKRTAKANRFYAESMVCRERPGVWFRLCDQVRQCYLIADKIRDERFASFRPKGHWKVAVRDSHKREGVWWGDVYVMYDPPPPDVDPDLPVEFDPAGADPWELTYANADNKSNNKKK